MSARTLSAIALLGALAAPAAAQPRLAAGAGFGFESYLFSEDDDVGLQSLSLWTVPLGARVRLTRALSLEASGAWASGRAELPDGSAATISGPTDTEIRLSLSAGRDLLTVTAIALLPTGVESLSAAEAGVAGLVAADVLPFAISNWGSGGGFGLSTSVARPFGDFAAGLSVGYVVAREFQPLADDAFQYRPGDQLHVRAAIDRTFGSAGKAALVVTVERFAEDEIDGSNLFQTGDRYQAVGSYAFAAGARASGVVYGGWQRREQGEFDADARVLPAQDLILAGAGLDFPAGRILLQPAADIRVLRRDDGAGRGWTATAGAAAEVPLGTLAIVPTARGRFGSVLLRDGAESGFSGVELGLALRFGNPGT